MIGSLEKEELFCFTIHPKGEQEKTHTWYFSKAVPFKTHWGRQRKSVCLSVYFGLSFYPQGTVYLWFWSVVHTVCPSIVELPLRQDHGTQEEIFWQQLKKRQNASASPGCSRKLMIFSKQNESVAHPTNAKTISLYLGGANTSIHWISSLLQRAVT